MWFIMAIAVVAAALLIRYTVKHAWTRRSHGIRWRGIEWKRGPKGDGPEEDRSEPPAAG